MKSVGTVSRHARSVRGGYAATMETILDWRWIDAPPCYGPRKTLYNRLVRWAAKGVWQELFMTLAAAGHRPRF